MAKTYFIYQCFMNGSEKLYKSGLSERESNIAFDELDRLIANGGCGDGCAVRGNLKEPSDIYVAKRLGLV